MKVAIFYGTYKRHTEKIAQTIQEQLQQKGVSVSCMPCSSLNSSTELMDADGVIIGSPVRAGKHHGKVVGFVKTYRQQIMLKQTAFFQVSLFAKRNTPAANAEIQKYINTFEQETAWIPQQIGSFAGALPYTRYNIFIRLLMKQVNKRFGGDTDTSKDYIYTDWEQVKQFADNFVARFKK